jgi:uncharacterized protein YbjT (DUF2867 family)
MSETPTTVLLVGGGTGVLGRGILREIGPRYRLVSFHRRPDPQEQGQVHRYIAGDVTDEQALLPALEGVDAIVNVVWYRPPGPDALFQRTAQGILKLARRARERGIRKFVQISLPPAPEFLERRVPYLARRRELERGLQGVPGLDLVRIQPSAVFGPRDRLIQEMRRIIRTYHLLPMWGDGHYHVSPIFADDVGWVVGEALEGRVPPVILVGGPDRFTYRDLSDLLFRCEGRPPRYWKVGPSTGRWLVRILNALGIHSLYTYEYEWLISDMLGLPEPPHPGREFHRLAEFLTSPA